MEYQKKTCSCISQFVSLSESPILTRTKLIKMVYLLERENYFENENYNSMVTYSLYTYGPYSEDLIDSIRECIENNWIKEEEIYTENGTAYNYVIGPEFDTSEIYLRNRKRIKEILNLFGHVDTTDIVKFVSQLPEVDSTQKYGLIKFDDVKYSIKDHWSKYGKYKRIG